MLHSSKYNFRNTNIDYEFGFTFGTHNAQIKAKILTLLEQILNQQNLEEDDCDGGLYSGLGGIAYMFLHLLRPNEAILTAPERTKIAPIIQRFLNAQLLYYSRTREATANTDSDHSQKVGFLVGDAGVYAVGAVLARAIGNEELQFQCVTEFVAAANVAKRKNFHKKGSDDLFYGRAGYLCGALWLNQYLGYQPVPNNDLFTIWKLIVQSGRENAKKIKNCRYPLAYTFCDKEYIGAAHGLSSILQVLLSWPQFLTSDANAEKDIRKTLDYFVRVVFQDYGVNFAPCTTDEIKLNPSLKQQSSTATKPWDENFNAAHRNGLAQWCYGAPGFVYLLAKAGLHYKSHEYLKHCVKFADLIWTYGLIKKGPGLCHGIAGNGYVFLLLYRLTENDPKYLYRALRFAEFLFSSQFREESEIPDHPFSLFEGLSGAICFLSDVIRPASAEFPFFNVFYEPGLTTVQPMPLAIPNIASELISQLQAVAGGSTIPVKEELENVCTNNYEEEDMEYGAELTASHLLQIDMQIKEEPVDIDHHLWRYSPPDGRGDDES